MISRCRSVSTCNAAISTPAPHPRVGSPGQIPGETVNLHRVLFANSREIAGAIASNLLYPCCESVGVATGVDVVKSLDQGVLRDIFGVLWVAGDRQCNAVGGPKMLLHEVPNSLRIACRARLTSSIRGRGSNMVIAADSDVRIQDSARPQSVRRSQFFSPAKASCEAKSMAAAARP